MAIANGTCVSFCNQPRAHFGLPGYARGTIAFCNQPRAHFGLPGYARGTIAFCNQPRAHFGLPGYARGTIAVSVTRMKRGFNACQKHRSIHPFIFNRLRAIARYWSEIATFSYPLSFNAPVGGCSHRNYGKSVVHRKLESWGNQAVRTV